MKQVFLAPAYRRAAAKWGRENRTRFFRAAAEAMRCILVDNARKKSRWKRGGRLKRVDLEGLEVAAEAPPETLLVVHEALDRLAAEDAPKAAAVLGLSEPTTKRYWEYARAWLLREIKSILAEG